MKLHGLLEAPVKGAPSMDTSRQTDQALVEAFRQGDVEAFGQLMSKHKPRLSRVIARMFRDKGDAEDVVQDAFVNAYRGLQRFRGDSSFYTWLYRIAVNSAKNQLAIKQRYAAVSQPISEVMTEAPEQTANVARATPMLLLENKQAMKALTHIIDGLAPQFSVPLVHFAVEGKAYSEIAAIMGCPIGTIRSRIARGRAPIAAKIALAETRRA